MAVLLLLFQLEYVYRSSEVTMSADVYCALTYSVLSLKPGSDQVSERCAKGHRGDKTGWTKPRSSRAALAMGIPLCAAARQGRHVAKNRMAVKDD